MFSKENNFCNFLLASLNREALPHWCLHLKERAQLFSMVSLSQTLVSDLFSLLVCIKSSGLIFFVEKKYEDLCTAKVPHIFGKKNVILFAYNRFESLKP